MRWRKGRRSTNVEDLRGQSGGGGMGDIFGRMGGRRGGGPRRGGMRLPVGRKGGGLIGLVIVVGVVLLLGGDLGSILGGMTGGGAPDGRAPAPSGQTAGVRETGQKAQDELADFVSVVLADTEDTWQKLFKAEGAAYREPTLVLFDGMVRSACGMGQAAMGPFYCPGDQKVYIDLAFYRDLKERFRAPGDFAQAYVIAHEVGHHVQTLIGVADKVQQKKRQVSREQGNAIQVRMELQADCFAGVWAHHADRARNILEAGDIDEALNAAAAIGDDRIQRQTQGRVTPESFTHGSSEQRQRWVKRGLNEGRVGACDTFSADRL